MVKTSQFKAKLRQCDPEIRQYIATLESHNLRLQRQLGKLEANNITAINRIKALEKTINDSAPQPRIDFRLPGHEEPEVGRLTELRYTKNPT